MSSQLAPAIMSHDPGKPRISPLGWAGIVLGAALVAFLLVNHLAHHGAEDGAGHGHGAHVPPLWGLGVLPFVAILGAIAVLPLVPGAHHWWESNLNRLAVALACAGLTIVYYLAALGPDSIVPMLDHAIPGEYVPFIVLLFSLYVISGGISLKGDLAAHPATNTGFLALGALIASFVGTTGASMLLIRPLLQTNQERRNKVHTVIFFIFLVSNIGGTLLPIGDPPLFLGYLRGVPFFWTLGRWAPWLATCAVLLVVYFVWDTLAYRREAPEDVCRDETERTPLRLRGTVNVLWLLGIVLAVAFIVPGKPFPLLGFTVFPFLREFVMLVLVGLSLATTPAGVRASNEFNYAAILEVAALFVGIFVAMQVPIAVLQASGESLSQYINQPWHFFWATGSLSSFLDNAPTYVVFFELGKVMPTGPDALALGKGAAIGVHLLVAVSLGAVFMGAMTYIGNGPNFMVKAIAEQSGVRMPTFFGYLFKYSLPILVPTFVLVTLLFV